MKEQKNRCPCCGYYQFDKGPGSFEICPICYWEDDKIQRDDPDYQGGANPLSLNECRNNYKKFGACEARFIALVRKPTQEEIEHAKNL